MKTAFVSIAGVGLVLNATQLSAAEYNTGPVAIIQCPANGKMARNYDLSTGIAPWIVEGPGLANGKARATPIDEASLPKGWTARLPGAAWVQAMPVPQTAAHATGEYVFTLSFRVKKGKHMPHLKLSGALVSDESFDLTLIEPSAPNQHVGSGIGAGDERPDEAVQDDVQQLLLTQSADGSGKPLGHRMGLYTIRIDVQNGTEKHAALGMLARVKLSLVCGGRK